MRVVRCGLTPRPKSETVPRVVGGGSPLELWAWGAAARRPNSELGLLGPRPATRKAGKSILSSRGGRDHVKRLYLPSGASQNFDGVLPAPFAAAAWSYLTHTLDFERPAFIDTRL